MTTKEKKQFIHELHKKGVIGYITTQAVEHYLDGKSMNEFPPVLVFEGEEHLLDGKETTDGSNKD